VGEAPVTIAVVNTNAHDLLAACLRSIEPEVNAGLAEAWVVDNASADGSPEMVEREFPWVHLVASPENLGFPQAANLAADRTSGQWFATANEDIELTPGALETLLEAAERHPEAAIIAPRLVLPDGSTQHTVYSFPTFLVTAAHHLGLQRLSRRLGERLCLVLVGKGRPLHGAGRVEEHGSLDLRGDLRQIGQCLCCVHGRRLTACETDVRGS